MGKTEAQKAAEVIAAASLQPEITAKIEALTAEMLTTKSWWVRIRNAIEIAALKASLDTIMQKAGQ